MTIKKSKEIHKTRKTIESWLNDSWESAFLLQAHHDLICVHILRSPHPEAHEETCSWPPPPLQREEGDDDDDDDDDDDHDRDDATKIKNESMLGELRIYVKVLDEEFHFFGPRRGGPGEPRG